MAAATLQVRSQDDSRDFRDTSNSIDSEVQLDKIGFINKKTGKSKWPAYLKRTICSKFGHDMELHTNAEITRYKVYYQVFAKVIVVLDTV